MSARRNNERKADMNETTFDQFVADEKGMRLFQQERLAAEITELMCRTMRECGINRSQLADRLHKSKGRISQILNAETNLTLRTVADIFTVLGKTLTIDAQRPVCPKGTASLFGEIDQRNVLRTLQPLPMGRSHIGHWQRMYQTGGVKTCQMPPTTKSLLTLTAVVASRVRINGIRLRCCRATADLPSPGTPLRIEFGFNGETTADRESNKIAVRAFLMVRANTADGSESRSLAFQLEAEFLLDYAINSFDGITEEELDAFGKMNGIYNVWPYWRQYVQNNDRQHGVSCAYVACSNRRNDSADV